MTAYPSLKACVRAELGRTPGISVEELYRIICTTYPRRHVTWSYVIRLYNQALSTTTHG